MEQDTGSVLEGAWDTGEAAEATAFLHTPVLGETEGDACWAGTGLQPVGGPGPAGNREARLAEQLGARADLGHPESPQHLCCAWEP